MIKYNYQTYKEVRKMKKFLAFLLAAMMLLPCIAMAK